ncbi:hypothetical protein MicroSTF_03745 [Microbacterium sp. STF-2]|uniref:hypothetical protein n=2 Tax=Microbacterium TaxID=33882 RepID=UPI0026189647|nr:MULTISPECIES: hypothetical protein [unclassified Microbacterium]MCV0333426.1 hypothetical protein [Microbacterium sp.]MCV0374706.1 hypothetical protein [Microbacterium sp.]MCV0388774.1 hypothetical protein [Microbacterium sp.]MCV0417302.1 hypothetical protein [Microbacterium sp.]MCV0420613.1 hypothetical protein [Microbacterium sp.]
MNFRIMSAAAGVLLLVGALTACAAPEPRTSPTPDAGSPQPTPSSVPVTSPTPEPAETELTCESMISAGTVTALADAGWTAETKEFVVGGVELTEGLLCFWADYTVGSDHGQLYGWSPVDDSDAAAAQAALLAEGWKREDGPDGVYFTEDARYAMGTDEDGYGMTYLFGDGWVRLADTRQGLILIEWPR